jgi:hypothetical protein
VWWWWWWWWWLKLHILALVASANDECTFVPHFADSGLFFWLPGDPTKLDSLS